MGRPPRVTEPGLAYHVLNRRVTRLPLFQKDDDYLEWETPTYMTRSCHPHVVITWPGLRTEAL